MIQRIVVIGGVAAGPGAASKAKRTNPDADVLLVEEREHISYGICEIPYFLGNVFDNPDHLVVYTPERLKKEKGVSVMTLARAEEINTGRKTLAVRNLRKGKVEELPYDRLIIATGSRPRTLGLPGEDARNVFTVKSLDGAFALKKFLAEDRPQNAVIVGGGYIGMEMAEALVSNGISTTVVHRGEYPMSALEPEAKALVAEELEKNGVRFLRTAQVKRLIAEGNFVRRVETTQGELETDLVIIAIGVTPNTEIAMRARIQLGPNGGITTDQRQSTSLDGIYAAGDCCEVRNLVTHSWMYAPLATLAARQAWVAGENAAGGHAVFKGALRSLAVKVFSLEVARVGLSLREARESGFDAVSETITGNSRVGYFPGSEKLQVTLMMERKSRRLLGANIVGKDGAVLRANTVAAAIQHKLTVEEMSQLDLIYTPPFAPLWDPLLIAANALKKRK